MSIWSDPRKRFEQLDYWNRVRKANEKLLSINAFIAYLWFRKTEGQRCSCVKDTTEQADKKCSICFGTKIVGGYDRWGFDTVTMDSQFPNIQIEPNTLRIRTDLRPHRVVLDRGYERGEIITPYVEPAFKLGWDGFNSDDYIYNEHSGIDYYWQEIGKEDQWNPIVTFPSLSTERFVRFKIVLRRENQRYKSPVWGMLQVRYKIQNTTELKLSRIMTAGRDRSRSRDSYGNVQEDGGVRMWTINAPTMTDECFIELHTGQKINTRYRVVQFEHSEPGGVLLSQHLTLRILQGNEIYYKVF